MHSWNLEKIYSQNVASVGSIPQERFRVLREFKSKGEVKKAILDTEPAFKAGSDKRGAIRIAPAEKMDREEVKQKFFDALDKIPLVYVREIPKGPESPSGKFPSYVVKDDSDNEYVITVAGGAFSNEGMNYEREVFDEIKKYFDEDTEKPEFIEKLEKALDVEFSGYDPTKTFSGRVQRPLSDKGPQNKGEEIADFTLEDEDGKKYYISLKDIGGKTVGNAGAGGLFKVKGPGREVEFDKERDSVGKKLMDAADVDIDLVVDGLNDYINKTPSVEGLEKTVNKTDEADKDKIKDFLMSAFDYGYIYVKRKNASGDLEIIDLEDKDELSDFIGDIQEIELKYPYYQDEKRSRKNVSIVITTEEGRYSFDIRNASGGIIPKQINLVRLGSKKDIKAAIKSAKAIDRSDSELEKLLSGD